MTVASRAAQAIGGRARLRARAPRAHLEQPDLVDSRDAAAARADLDQLDGGDADRASPMPSTKRRCRAASKLYAVERLAAVHEARASPSCRPCRRRGDCRRCPRAPKKAAAMAPAAGPDSSIVTGARWASATWVSPPLDSMSRSGAGMPSPASCPAISREVPLGERLDVGVDHRGGRALVLADLRRHLVRGRDVAISGWRRGDEPRPPPPRGGVGVGVQEHDGDRRDAAPREPAAPRRRARSRRAAAARCRRPSIRSSTSRRRSRGTSGSGLRDVQVVELELALAPDLEGVARSPPS